jgi:peptidoglycan/LPS O-acetylase OafA/YrhL
MPSQSSVAACGDDFPNLDFLRAWAVLFVCGSHVLQFFGVRYFWEGRLSVERLGLWGVMIFFVHTCLVLMLSMERQRNATGFGRMYSSFMVRRCFRIYPLSIIAVLAVVMLKLPVAVISGHGGFWPWVKPSFAEILSNFGLVQNLTGHRTLLGPLWTLPLEVQMYLLLPAIFIFTGSKWPVMRTFALWLFGFALGTLALRGLLAFDLALYFPCFLPGVIAYRLQQKKCPQFPAFLWAAALAGLTVFAITESDRHFSQFWLGALLLGLAIPLFAQFSTPWIVVPSRITARYSYGIYLSHFICIWFAFVYLSKLPIALQTGAFILSFVGAPFLLYHGIEDPLIRVGKMVAKRITGPHPQARDVANSPMLEPAGAVSPALRVAGLPIPTSLLSDESGESCP